MPNSVTSIGIYAFFDCSGLTEINVENGNTAYASENGVLFNKDKTNLICYPAGKTETTYTIPNSVTIIGDYAFRGCSSLASVIIPNSVTKIIDGSFSGCSSLTSITIPNSVTSIGNYSTFAGCSSLTSITIPNSVTSIGGSAFYNCSSLASVTIPNSVTSIGDYAFYGCSGLTSITIPNLVTSIGIYAFYGCTGLTAICYEGRSEPTYQSSSFANMYIKIPVCVPEDYTSDTWCGFPNICKGHDKVTDNAVAATCTETGLTEGAHCSKCGKIFTTQEEIPALGHDYGEATYVWAEDGSSCTATTICKRNESHVVTENATITSEVTIASTCEGMGTTTYTAKFTDSKFSKQTKDVVDIPVLGHDYGEATYEW
ncbi:MAG: leucine-rich repeat domain-containing protein, partial [Salinivirgaceae bacterium]|nr:leucine-rich repeat domain-containing protein [Salinivirgaceae bacterium]